MALFGAKQQHYYYSKQINKYAPLAKIKNKNKSVRNAIENAFTMRACTRDPPKIGTNIYICIPAQQCG